MVFSSVVFLFFFLPVTLLLYFSTPAKYRNVTLLFTSLFFYTWGEDKVVFVLLASTVIDYSCALLIEMGRRKIGLFISITFNLAILVFFKYLNFSFENLKLLFEVLGLNYGAFEHIPQIALPIGISFYTFQTMSYTIDVYRGQINATKNIIEFAAYVCMFPQLVAGPIVRYTDIQQQLRHKNISVSNFTLGVERFITGLAKKVLIANTFASVADTVFAEDVTMLSSLMAWIGILAYTLQIYFDFSGYSDMAIGIGKMLGFDFMENFNYPYISTSIREFWRRWHISLSTWFRDYVYIPLGGSQHKKGRTYLNLVIVFFVTGLWHGASWNFVIWGLFHGFFLVVERIGFSKTLSLTIKPIQHLYTLIVVVVGWVFFRVENVGDAFRVLKKMFVYDNGDEALNSYLRFLTMDYDVFFFLGIAIVCSTPTLGRVRSWMFEKRISQVYWAGILLIFIVSIIYLSVDTYNPFIYFRF